MEISGDGGVFQEMGGFLERSESIKSMAGGAWQQILDFTFHNLITTAAGTIIKGHREKDLRNSTRGAVGAAVLLLLIC